MKKQHKFFLIMMMVGMQSFSAESSVAELTDKNYISILAGEKPVLVKFWAAWCRPCRKMAPHYRQASKTFFGKVIFTELNTDKYRNIARQHKVEGLPTTILFKNGKELNRLTKSLDQKQIEHWMHEALKQPLPPKEK